VRVIGGPGTIDGLFSTPRGVACDGRGHIYVQDRMGRIQKFDESGRFIRVWKVPTIEKGRPTSLAVDSEGFVWVADTHNYRVLKYSPDAELVFQFGVQGNKPGEFFYVCGIAVAEDGTIYVSEFGGNDRVQVFDRGGRYLRGWGSYGEGDLQFKRPQSLALGPGGRLYVADSSNHRVVVYDRSGRRLNSFGGYGAEPGRMKYPWGLAVARDGTLHVAEYGNHRLQRFDPDGRPLGTTGVHGAEPGELNTPWAVAFLPDESLVISDSLNHRVQVWPRQSVQSIQSLQSMQSRRTP
jgi:DNA-binding beta-propeller fold protein YncE